MPSSTTEKHSSNERDTEVRSLAERVKPRLAVEERVARDGHTYRHGPIHYLFENWVIRPTLRLGLRALGLYQTGLRNALTPAVLEVSLRFPNLPRSFDGFRILQISDFHIDGVDGLAEALVPILEKLAPDACVFTGDYRFEDRGPCGEIYPRMQRVIDAISAKHGIYAILGNHDAAEIAFALEDMGVRMLVNDAAEIGNGRESIWLLGVDDNYDYRCDDLAAALSGVPPQAFKVLLAHAPELYEDAASAGVSLYLSGHTHGGQIRIPGWGAIKQNARCPREYAYGQWRHNTMQGYTTSGVGCSSVPVRFNCPPEIVLFELKRGSRD